MTDEQLAALTDGERLILISLDPHDGPCAGHCSACGAPPKESTRELLTALADARLEAVNGLEDSVGWRWRVRDTEKRGLVLERLQLGRRPFWEEVAELAAYQPSAQDARSVRFRALLIRAEKAEAEVARLTEELEDYARRLAATATSWAHVAKERDRQREDIRRLVAAGVTDYSKLGSGSKRVDCHFCKGIWNSGDEPKHCRECPLAEMKERYDA